MKEERHINENIEDLVPKNKFDDSGIEELRMLSDEEIAPILPALLEWMKDMNWPIASGWGVPSGKWLLCR